MDASQLLLMEQAGVQVRKYHKPHWYQLGRLNNRTHSKLLVVDGQTGFTGEVGIADQWPGHALDPEQDLARSRQVTFQEWKDRSLAEKLWEHAASLFGSQL